MRCAGAQRLMASAVDGELTPRERVALDGHVAVCPACAREMRTTGALLAALDGLPAEAEVPVRLEQDTLRRVRLAADEPAPVARWRAWLGFPVPAFALAAVMVVALSAALLRRAGEMPAGVSPTHAPATQVAKGKQPPAAAAPTAVARATRPAPRVPDEPPPALAAAPDLFMDLPILRHMEKLEHFEAIRTTTIDDGPRGTGEQQGENG